MKTFLINQKIQPLANQYQVFESDEVGTEGALVAFAQQKRFAFKEKFTIFRDESKSDILVEIQARQVMDFGARYDVRDNSGNVIGVIGKAFGASILKSTWQIFKPGEEDAPYMTVSERSAGIAIARRVWTILPVVGEIPFFIKFNFDFKDAKSGEIQASYDKTTTFRDHYKLIIKNESSQDIDWKVYVAMGIMLDAMQGR